MSVQKPATIKEIAKQLKVSVSTVSRALHDHPSIGLRTKMQVQKLAAELKYEPNQAAISFKQGKTLTIGAILPNLGEEFFSIAINGIEDVAEQNNYTVLIGQSHDNEDREKKIIESMRKHRVDGIIVSVAKNTQSYEHFQQLQNYSIPVVFFDRIPDLSPVHRVYCDMKDATIKLIDWLVKNKHQRIGLIAGKDEFISSRNRVAGYEAGLQKNNLTADPDLVIKTDLEKESTITAIKTLLSLKKKPTAIIAFNDYLALEIIKYCKSKKLKINKDIWIVSYANLPISSYLDTPPLVSIEQFPYEQAEKATEILINQISNKQTTVHQFEDIQFIGDLIINQKESR